MISAVDDFEHPARPWRKSSRSFSNGGCLEAASVPGMVGVRDSKLDRSPVLVFPAEAWKRFAARLRADG